jgi:hypothetical protein
MPRKRFVVASRTALLLLVIAAVALLALGVATLIAVDPPEAEGWLRSVFGRVFGIAAIGLALVLGIPAGVGMSAMSGATAEGAVPALPRAVRLTLIGAAVATTVATGVVVVAAGTSVAVLNVGLVALVALISLGLAGAAGSSPHQGRAALSAFALVVVVAGVFWVLLRAPGLTAA